eukprot:CAMPEP_0177341620 /NCGR_PEP_ID=MMETSP0368-20130122/26599_1 /TAXON_ID=447022 ORGANISM="Scrippsiella hangoei-like, Strain SHHI-4" /NCGR_SAMPLE_ID=MMETSP0368 /ASSEMBLY_ACC=CAM_ASM_000363 /LENGTH=110 /DNA_ID=CAMNT_0018802917 /DNA_START=192 /DNA_END=522 /DNA_ORIENTATION=+
MTTLPKIKRLPAFVAGFKHVLTMQMPGRVTLPVFVHLRRHDLREARDDLMHSDFFNSVAVDKASARAPWVMLFALFMAFMALGAMAKSKGTSEEAGRKTGGVSLEESASL